MARISLPATCQATGPTANQRSLYRPGLGPAPPTCTSLSQCQPEPNNSLPLSFLILTLCSLAPSSPSPSRLCVSSNPPTLQPFSPFYPSYPLLQQSFILCTIQRIHQSLLWVVQLHARLLVPRLAFRYCRRARQCMCRPAPHCQLHTARGCHANLSGPSRPIFIWPRLNSLFSPCCPIPS
jgi:hypothetical protein